MIDAEQAARDEGTPSGTLTLGSLETTAALRLAPILTKSPPPPACRSPRGDRLPPQPGLFPRSALTELLARTQRTFDAATHQKPARRLAIALSPPPMPNRELDAIRVAS